MICRGVIGFFVGVIGVVEVFLVGEGEWMNGGSCGMGGLVCGIGRVVVEVVM